jgi:hypothetical protein
MDQSSNDCCRNDRYICSHKIHGAIHGSHQRNIASALLQSVTVSCHRYGVLLLIKHFQARCKAMWSVLRDGISSMECRCTPPASTAHQPHESGITLTLVLVLALVLNPGQGTCLAVVQQRALSTGLRRAGGHIPATHSTACRNAAASVSQPDRDTEKATTSCSTTLRC